MVTVSNCSYLFQGSSELRFPDVAVARGRHALLLGQSGSGKTTLLHLIGGLRRNYHGSVIVGDTELSSLRGAALDRFRGKNIGFIFQRNHLIQSLTVEDNLRLAPYLAGQAPDGQRILEVLERLQLTAHRNKHIRQLSQGQAQRVAIARAVLNRPLVILADEPTSALDDGNCMRVTELLLDVASENHASLVIATHDKRLMDRFATQIHLS